MSLRKNETELFFFFLLPLLLPVSVNSHASSGESIAATCTLSIKSSYFLRRGCHFWITSPTTSPLSSSIVVVELTR